MALIIPSVFADTVNEKLGKALKIASLAYDATKDVADIQTCGSEVHFPKFDRVASVGKVTKGTELVAAELSMSDNVATVNQAGGSVNIYDKDAAQIKGNTIDNLSQQLADAMAVDIDSSLVNSLDTESTQKSAIASATAVTETEMFNAMALFGDDQNFDSFSGIAIAPQMLPSFYAMDSFVSAEKTFAHTGNGIIQNNVIGYWMNIPVVLTSSCFDGTAKEAKVYFIKKLALGYIMQKVPTIEIERQASFLRNVIVASDMYATKVLDKSGIVIARKTIA
jgi:N4-gp56 family major capsid protein